ncbi:histone-lysine N-methyltransferase eggless-like [Brevipalpus obovatus]|uniref:histone-lysine N-methyltransferase eggless-like n=1 Tax=Brevipalpus obovatus TaxID=246614 RepID=UPI003D9DBF6D
MEPEDIKPLLSYPIHCGSSENKPSNSAASQSDIICLSSDDEIENDEPSQHGFSEEQKEDFLVQSRIEKNIEEEITKCVTPLDIKINNLQENYKDLRENYESFGLELAKTRERLEKYPIEEESFTTNAFKDPADDLLLVEGPFHRVVRICNIERRLKGDILSEKKMFHVKLGSFTPSSVVDDSDIQICSAKSGESNLERKIPPKGPVRRIILQKGDIVIACSNTRDVHCSPWKRAKIEETHDRSFMVKFLKDDHLPTSFVDEKFIAYGHKSDVLLPRKTRVVATIAENEESDEFYPGFVAETPTPTNHYRYLVFFDNGCACYIAIENVHLGHWNSIFVLGHAPQKMHQFLQQYFKNFPERKMVKFQVKDKIKVLFDGKWVKGYVEKIDCNTVQVSFRGLKVKQWLYRGSPRLYLLSEQAALKNSQTKKVRAVRKITDQRDVRFGNFRRPYVQYTYAEEDEEKDIFLPRKDRNFHRESPLLDQPSKIVQVPGIPVRKFRPKLYTPHNFCYSPCLRDVDEESIEMRDVNPFQLPIIYGWERATVKFSGKFERIFYTAPCGRRLRSIDEIYSYITAVKSELSIDLFSFSSRLKLFTPRNLKLLPAKSFQFTQDIARGTERHSISCINFKNHTPMPIDFEYCSKRFPSPSVNLDLDPNFLMCCDCKDNCADSQRCSCQQRTLNTYADYFPGRSISVYEHRRLQESIISGIWECNSECSCNDKCQNRVVQNGMIAQLQIFYTGPEKGWGIRALHDIPRGTFLCVYAAQILDGSQDSDQNDEYFADLDYLECVEGLQKEKDGFEEAPIETISSDESENDSSGGSYEASDSERDFKKSRREESHTNNSDLANRNRPSQSSRRFQSIREFHDETEAYILDAKFRGNIGRFINHSCGPNCFVQNVFIDSHDLRFPWVAFFAGSFISAYEELTWNYGYTVDSIPGRKVKCHCGSRYCRGRLL